MENQAESQPWFCDVEVELNTDTHGLGGPQSVLVLSRGTWITFLGSVGVFSVGAKNLVCFCLIFCQRLNGLYQLFYPSFFCGIPFNSMITCPLGGATECFGD